jgi:hypothetical protein
LSPSDLESRSAVRFYSLHYKKKTIQRTLAAIGVTGAVVGSKHTNSHVAEITTQEFYKLETVTLQYKDNISPKHWLSSFKLKVQVPKKMPKDALGMPAKSPVRPIPNATQSVTALLPEKESNL